MGDSKIEVDGENIIITLKNAIQGKQSYQALGKLYCLMVGSDVLANDSVCYLLCFENELWLIPDMTTGASGLKGWFEQLTNDNKAVIASIDYLPMSWRLKFLIFPGAEANLKIMDISELDRILDELTIASDSILEDVF
jgi:hypothetical protein